MKYRFEKFMVIFTFVLLGIYQSNGKSLISSVRSIKTISFCGERVPLESQEVLERFEKEFMLKLYDKPQVYLWLKRANRYFPIIETILKRNGLPDDLKYISIIESALLPNIGSAKGALGFWQFTESTGREYGLIINSNIDERRNIFKSTNSAAKYFKMLYDKFASWTLVAAAFNMGENGLMAAIKIQNLRDYYKLFLPLETQRFIFKILSAKLIMSRPESFGFRIEEEDFYPQITFDVVEVYGDEFIPIQIVAHAVGTTYKIIKDFNPEIRGYYLSPGSHMVFIPDGTKDKFYQNYSVLYQKWLTFKKKSLYTVQQGDHLSSIAEQFGIPIRALQIWNRLDDQSVIYPGDQLIVIPWE